MESLERLAKRLAPDALVDWLRRRRLERLRRENESKSAAEVFGAVYAKNLWGGAPGEYNSGRGSDPDLVGPYCALVRRFVAERGVRSVLDVGCGDFRVGRQLLEPGVRYLGVDVVPDLIARNAHEFGTDLIEFRTLNVVEDALPGADLVLVRQVLQHLSNAEIARVLDKLRRFPRVLITEHYPAPGARRAPNLDKPHGGDTRIPDGSAVYLDEPPFLLRDLRLVLETPLPRGVGAEGETLRTFLLEPGA